MKIWLFLVVCGLAYASAVRYDDDFNDLDDLDLDKEQGSGLADRLKERLQKLLDRVKARMEKNKDVGAEFADRLKEITKHIASIGKEVNRKTLETVRIINRKIADLSRDVLRKITGGKLRRQARDLLTVAKEIKAELMKPDGYHEFKRHIMNLRSDHPVLQVLQSYIISADDAHLREILADLLSGIPNFYRARYASTKLEKLFVELAAIIKTDEGFDQVYEYFQNLKPSHYIVMQLQMILESVDKEMVKDILGQLIASLES